MKKFTRKKIRVRFEDQGQDLLWLDIDLQEEMIITCGPFHHKLYGGKYIFCPRSISIGSLVHYSDTPITLLYQPLTTFKYKVVDIEEL